MIRLRLGKSSDSAIHAQSMITTHDEHQCPVHPRTARHLSLEDGTEEITSRIVVADSSGATRHAWTVG